MTIPFAPDATGVARASGYPTMGAYDPMALQMALRVRQLADEQRRRDLARGIVGGVADMIPGVGDLKSGFDGAMAALRGDMVGAGLSALGALPFVTGAIGPLYHGTRHAFDKFDMARVGTGEGNAGFGHGIYLAESRPVGEGYRAQMSPDQVTYGGQPLRSATDEQAAINVKSRMYGGKDAKAAIADVVAEERKKAAAVENVIARLRRQANAAPTAQEREAIEASIARHQARAQSYYRRAASLQGVDPTNVHYDRGMLYTAEFDADPNEVLSWDAPLASQSPAIKRAMRSLGIDDMALTGGQAYEALSAGDQARASANLLAQGVKGIKYLDQSSRVGAGSTHNYVVFTDELLRIVNREGGHP